MFVCELFLKRARPAADVGATLGRRLLCGRAFVDDGLSASADGEGGWNPWVILAYIFIIWANDVFAYLVGVSVGRHHLYERISPNKSWEGSSAASSVRSPWVALPHGGSTVAIGCGAV